MQRLRKHIPRDRADIFGVCTTLVLLTFVTVNVLITIDANKTNNELQSAIVLVIGLFIGYNAYANMLMAICTDTTLDSIDVQIKQLPEWRFCSICELYAPPRSHHCLTCDKCVLKRHNHCLFLGKCVGYKNHRYYLMFLWYVWLGSMLNTILNWTYFTSTLSELSGRSLLITFMPLFAWLLGMLSLKAFFFVFTNSICLILSLLMLVYFGLNLRMVLNGQTWNESAKRDETYNISWRFNLALVLGRRSLVAVLNALGTSALFGDGTSFRKRDCAAHHHDRNSQQQHSSSLDGHHHHHHGLIDPLDAASTTTPFNVPKRRVI